MSEPAKSDEEIAGARKSEVGADSSANSTARQEFCLAGAEQTAENTSEGSDEGHDKVVLKALLGDSSIRSAFNHDAVEGVYCQTFPIAFFHRLSDVYDLVCVRTCVLQGVSRPDLKMASAAAQEVAESALSELKRSGERRRQQEQQRQHLARGRVAALNGGSSAARPTLQRGSQSVLQRMRERRRQNRPAVSSRSEEAPELSTAVTLMKSIVRYFHSDASVLDRGASSRTLLERFRKHHVGANGAAAFKAALKRLCHFSRQSKVWKLREEFRTEFEVTR